MSGLRAFTMPKWGIEMEEGTVADWMVGEGADFAKGDLVTLIETDKITNEYEAEFPARLARIVTPAGEVRPVGALLAVFADPGSSPDAAALDAFVASYRPGGAAAATPPAASVSPPAPQPTVAAAPPAIPDGLAISPAARQLAEARGVDVASATGSGRDGRLTYQDVDQLDRPAPPPVGGAPVSIAPTTAALDTVFASPLAKRLAVQHGVDLSGIAGSGRRGRIGKADVLACIAPAAAPAAPAPEATPEPVAPPAPPPTPATGVEVVRMSAMRKAIARQLTLSKSTIPHFYLRNSARVDALNSLRAQAKRAAGEAPSINDYLIRAVALALKAHPDVNIQVHGEEIHRFPHADVAVAVATDKGLLTPIVRAADTKSVAAISAEVKTLAARARAGKLASEEFQGGSFSVSNLGMFGIEQFDAIINPPQGAILAVGAARQAAMGVDHALTFATRIQLSLSCDHRAIDGAVGARFLAELTRLIETPEDLTA
ncbi:2-oxo acid dehydrogenase subunit E2 [Sphingomonas jatrophae]|uniref:Dihydrolipoamide acetyltransferase component of pyruvate dehydrogenase complex n=1 Tax=Sphingomonas jatrophae TaxID=1166337 RepID=A0A1I6M459_9SPHN|nr:2-oxo acid dehydrogenase subunit E2 [Sphingomonas jatrophae]SFS10459.1 pyruvate dehydrogenase E2 component (dihydrolipoamide acetyltransferase) [Sphingomonas jatrophae]